MDFIKQFSICFLLVLVFTNFIGESNEKIPKSIIVAITSGNSKDLATFFNSNIELTILDKEDVYSKIQAELILKDFFITNPPINFILLLEGTKDGAQYAIGNLNTTIETFKVYFLMKSIGNYSYIQQFRIEKEEE